MEELFTLRVKCSACSRIVGKQTKKVKKERNNPNNKQTIITLYIFF